MATQYRLNRLPTIGVASLFVAILMSSGCQATQPDTSDPVAIALPYSSDDCHDAVVAARIIRQTPSVRPECDDCIIMRWPWFIELDVQRALQGKVRRGRQLVLSVQHNDFRRGLGTTDWRLRRNSEGGFNLLGFAEDGGEACPAGTPPSEPPISGGPDTTLEDLRKQGAEYYGRP